MSKPDDKILSEIKYTLRDPKHGEEKPYFIRYDTGGAIPDSNTSSRTQAISIHNFRPKQDPGNFGDYGFSVERPDLPWTETIFDENYKIVDDCYPQIESILRRKFPDAAGVHVLEHGV